MSRSKINLVVSTLALLLAGGSALAQLPLGTPFIYEGQLIEGGSAATGSLDVESWLFDAAVGVEQIGPTVVNVVFADDDRRFTQRVDSVEVIHSCVNPGGRIRIVEPGERCNPSETALVWNIVGPSGPKGPPGPQGKPGDSHWLLDKNNTFYLAGNVGIGTDSPGEKLVVDGNIQTSGTIRSGSSITIDGAANTISSDADLELHVSSGRAIRIEGNATSPNLIGGYRGNSVASGIEGATISGGGFEFGVNEVTADFGTVGGGQLNTASGFSATVPGGESNTASGDRSTIGGGDSNTASDPWSTVGGGDSNTASEFWATVSGGRVNTASKQWSTVSGGLENTASGTSSTVGGGEFNTASGVKSTVAGGWSNTASDVQSTVGGGVLNEASDIYAIVAGGHFNTASGLVSTVGGGDFNTASGEYATVPGGRINFAGGDYSFAAGRRAKVRDAAQAGEDPLTCPLGTCGDEGSFVWADSSDFDFPAPTEGNIIPGPNQFLARATGGAVFVSAINGATGDSTAGVELASGGGSWSSLSSRDAKENVDRVDGREVLERLRHLPIATWNYKAQDESIRHIGPMAQDFSAAFGVGEKETMITTLDADGVALAAIQGLHEIVKEKEAEIAAVRAKNTELEARLERLEALIGAVAGERNGGAR